MEPDEEAFVSKAIHAYRASKPNATGSEIGEFARKALADHRTRKPAAYQDKLEMNPGGAGQELQDHGANDTTMMSEAPKIKAASLTRKAQGREAGMAGQVFQELKEPVVWGQAVKNYASPLYHGIIAPIKNGAEMAADVLDTGGRLGRETITSSIENRPGNYEDAMMNRNDAGAVGPYLDAIHKPDSKTGAVMQGIGGGLSSGVGHVGSALTGQPAVGKWLTNAGRSTGEIMAADLLSYIAAGPGGATEAAGQFERALVKSGQKLAPEARQAFLRLYEEAGQSGPQFVQAAKSLYSKLGGAAEHLNLIAGPELEQLGASRYRVGVPFMQEKLGFEPGRVIADIGNKLPGVSVPENATGRAAEFLARKLPGGFDLPKWSREGIHGERAKAVNVARANVLSGAEKVKTMGEPELANVLSKGKGNLMGHLPREDMEREAVQLLTSRAKQQALKRYDLWLAEHLGPELKPQQLADVKLAGRLAFGELGKKGLPLYDAFLSTFKQVRLHGNPAWASLNAVEDAHKMWLAGIRNPLDLVQARKAATAPDMTVVLTTPSGREWTAGELRQMFKEQGALHAHSGAKFGMNARNTPLQQGIVDVGSLGVNRLVKPVDEFREALQKQTFLVNRMKRGIDPNTAGNQMREALFDVNVGAATKSMSQAEAVTKRLIPFIGYTTRSMKVLPKLAARDPGSAMFAIRAGQGAMNEAEQQYTPKKYERTSASYFNLPDSMANPVRDALGVDKPYAVSVQNRGTAVEPFSNVENLTDLATGSNPESLGQLSPLLSLGARHTFDIGPFGQEGKGPTLGEATGTLMSTPEQRLFNMLMRRLGDAKQSTVGPQVDYFKNGQLKSNVAANEILGLANSFSPTGQRLSLTSPADTEADKSYSAEARRVKKGNKKAKKDRKNQDE